MTDAALIFDAANNRYDLALSGPDLATDDGLRTAVIISLLTAARAHDDDTLPSQLGVDGIGAGGDGLDALAAGARRGWWGDLFADADGDRIGSRRWLLIREKATDDTLRRCRDYDREALAWLIEDGIAATVEVTAEWTRPGLLGELIVITRPDGTRADFRFDRVWSAT